MDLNAGVGFLAGAILFAVGLGVLGLVLLVLNNLFSKYWKPIKFIMYAPVQYRVAEPEEVNEKKK